LASSVLTALLLAALALARRYLFAFAVAVSLLLGAAVAAAWVESADKDMGLRAEWGSAEAVDDGELPLHETLESSIESGVIWIRYGATLSPNRVDNATGRLFPVRRTPLALAWHVDQKTGIARSGTGLWDWHLSKMEQVYDGGGTYDRFRYATFPAWSLILLCSGMPMWYALRTLRRRNRKKRNYCSRCGYNLTGNISGTCPECGSPVPKASANKARDERASLCGAVGNAAIGE
jgi:hypothetical protein